MSGFDDFYLNKKMDFLKNSKKKMLHFFDLSFFVIYKIVFLTKRRFLMTNVFYKK